MKALLSILLVFQLSCGERNTSIQDSKRPKKNLEKVESPEDLLRQILSASKQKKYNEIEKLIYPLKNDTWVKAILHNIKKADVNETGDGSYSDKALELIIKKYLNFSSQFDMEFLDSFYEIDPKLKNIPVSNFKVLKEKDFLIITMMDNNGYRLLFWEGMNHLINK